MKRSTFEMYVETGKIREFARATGSSHADFLEAATPVSPPTFLMSAAFWQVRVAPRLADVRKLLHGAQEFSFPNGPPVAGSRLTGTRWIDKQYTKKGRRSGRMEFTESVTEFRDESGALIASLRGTGIIIASTPEPERADSLGRIESGGGAEVPGPSSVARPAPAPSDSAGPLVPRVELPLTITDFVRYQGASGDMNPIHHDVAVARSAGYAGPIAVGMRQAGILANYATDWLGPANLRHFSARFVGLARPGDVLTYRGAVVADEMSQGGRTLDLDLRCTRPDGALHILGSASFTVPKDFEVTPSHQARNTGA